MRNSRWEELLSQAESKLNLNLEGSFGAILFLINVLDYLCDGIWIEQEGSNAF